MSFLPRLVLFTSCLFGISLNAAESRDGGGDDPATRFSFERREGELEIRFGNHALATYCWADPQTTRPYFKQVHAANSAIQLTRNHPPQKGDFQDHETFHPGIWWGFGDVGGNDYWRMKARIIGGDFVEEPAATPNSFSFAVRNRLLTNDGASTFCEQVCRYRFVHQTGQGMLMICESTMQRDADDFWLGDQEEMGLAIRVATPLTMQHGGMIRDSSGHTDLRQIRTHQSDWCHYSGSIADAEGNAKFGGLMLMHDPANFRKPWWHAVDSGLLIANPLGESELTGRGKKRENVLVKKGEPFRLRYGCLIYLHDDASEFDPARAYRSFLEQLD